MIARPCQQLQISADRCRGRNRERSRLAIGRNRSRAQLVGETFPGAARGSRSRATTLRWAIFRHACATGATIDRSTFPLIADNSLRDWLIPVAFTTRQFALTERHPPLSMRRTLDSCGLLLAFAPSRMLIRDRSLSVFASLAGPVMSKNLSGSASFRDAVLAIGAEAVAALEWADSQRPATQHLQRIGAREVHVQIGPGELVEPFQHPPGCGAPFSFQ